MKTPEEWLESNRLNGAGFDCAMLHISEIKQIQLDAWKQGMLDAAGIAAGIDKKNLARAKRRKFIFASLSSTSDSIKVFAEIMKGNS